MSKLNEDIKSFITKYNVKNHNKEKLKVYSFINMSSTGLSSKQLVLFWSDSVQFQYSDE